MASTIGQVLDELYNPSKVALMVVGEEVPHVHLHVVPFTSVGQLDFGTADPDPDHDVLAATAPEIIQALEAGGHSPC